MRSSHVWEAALVSLLIIAGVGAFSAWNAVRSRARRPAAAVEQQGEDAAVRKAVDAVQLYASFKLGLNGPVFIDERTIQKSAIAAADGTPLWNISGVASGESIHAANIRWIVHVAESPPEIRLVRLNGEVVFAADEADADAAKENIRPLQ